MIIYVDEILIAEFDEKFKDIINKLRSKYRLEDLEVNNCFKIKIEKKITTVTSSTK